MIRNLKTQRIVALMRHFIRFYEFLPNLVTWPDIKLPTAENLGLTPEKEERLSEQKLK